ncbi:MAG: VOC family protein [Planctomycetales bacterium]|nr:VOC family protein [Planctomycetales bacterium]
MKVMVLVKATAESEAGEMPSEQLLTEMGKFNEALVEAGVMRDGEGLKPSAEGVRVRFSGNDRIVTDGPFAETKELVAGYWLWEVESLQAAVEWVKRCPNPMASESEIEIRPLYEMSDFAEADPQGTHARHEEGLRQRLATERAIVQPYLFFAGRCEEALDFYQQALGAKVLFKLRFNESPDPTPEGMLQPGFEAKIMHASFQVGEMTLLASDGCDDKTNFEGFRLAMTVPTEADCERVFTALANGGQVDMPLMKTFWSPLYGMVTDKFNVGWMVMVRSEEHEAAQS